MPTLFVGSQKVSKGIEYQGIIPQGNAFRITHKVGISINHSPTAEFPIGTDIINHPDFTYMFDADTVVLLSRVVTPELSIVYENTCFDDVPLVANVESVAICSVINIEEIVANGGQFASEAYVQSTSNQPKGITIRIYSDNVLLDTKIQAYGANESKSIVIDFSTVLAITAGKTNHFTIEADGADCEVKGTINPSIIKIEKTKL